MKTNIFQYFQCPLCSFSCRGDDLIRQHVRLHMAVIYKHRQEAEKLVGDIQPVVSSAKTTPMKINGTQKSPNPKKRKNNNIFINVFHKNYKNS